jgi:hypothetical protein
MERRRIGPAPGIFQHRRIATAPYSARGPLTYFNRTDGTTYASSFKND